MLLDRSARHNGTRAQGVYPALDRFGRIINHKWIDDTFTTGSDSRVPNIPPIVELTYTYDKASNRLAARDRRPGNDQPLRHEYDYDGLHRLTQALRGAWSGTGIPTGAKYTQDWSLDALGNWNSTRIDIDGDGSLEASETEERTHDIVNELLTRDPNGSGGNDTLDPSYANIASTRFQHDF